MSSQQQAAFDMRKAAAEHVWQMEHDPAAVRQWAIDMAVRCGVGPDARSLIGAARLFVAYVERGE